MSYPVQGGFAELTKIPRPLNSNLSKFVILGKKPVFLVVLDSQGSPVVMDDGEIYKGRNTVSRVSVDLIARGDYLVESFRPKRASTVWTLSPATCDFLLITGWGALDVPANVDSLRLEVWAPSSVIVRVFSYPQGYAVP